VRYPIYTFVEVLEGLFFALSKKKMAEEQPKPQSFAVMRNCHEAFRGAIRANREYIVAGDLKIFKREWGFFLRALHVHAIMEDDGVFRLLDDACDNAIAKAGLHAEHDRDHELTAIVTKQTKKMFVNQQKLLAAYDTWSEEHLKHIKHEEDVMMPLIPKTVPSPPTPQKMGRIFHDRVLAAGVKTGDFNFFVAYVVKKLTLFGSADNPAKIATRVWVWGLQNASSPAQWKDWLPIVKENTSQEIYEHMVKDFKIEDAGKITD
jgi:hypothetical protein